MDRMKTFMIYILLIIGFFAVSVLLENGLLLAMYAKISGETDGYYVTTNSYFLIQNDLGKACNINGYLNFDLTNTTGNYIDNCYLKIDLYNELNLLADTEYVQISGMQMGESKTFHIKFKANHIKNYKISMVQDIPDKTNILNILGWEIDLTNVFGLGIDISNMTIFGTRLGDLFTWSNIKGAGNSFWTWIVAIATGIPTWGYGLAWLIVVGLL